MKGDGEVVSDRAGVAPADSAAAVSKNPPPPLPLPPGMTFSTLQSRLRQTNRASWARQSDSDPEAVVVQRTAVPEDASTAPVSEALALAAPAVSTSPFTAAQVSPDGARSDSRIGGPLLTPMSPLVGLLQDPFAAAGTGPIHLIAESDEPTGFPPVAEGVPEAPESVAYEQLGTLPEGNGGSGVGLDDAAATAARAQQSPPSGGRACATVDTDRSLKPPLLLDEGEAEALASSEAEAEVAYLWESRSDMEIATDIERTLSDFDALSHECDQLFNACTSYPSDVPESQAEAEPPAERLIRPKALHIVTQRLIDRLGSRSTEVLERIGYIYGAAAAHRGDDLGSAGIGPVEFRGFVAAVLTQILRELEERHPEGQGPLSESISTSTETAASAGTGQQLGQPPLQSRR